MILRVSDFFCTKDQWCRCSLFFYHEQNCYTSCVLYILQIIPRMEAWGGGGEVGHYHIKMTGVLVEPFRGPNL